MNADGSARRSSNDSSVAASSPIDRRRFIGLTGAAAGAVLAGRAQSRATAARRAPWPPDVFTLGVASGDPRPDAVVLWTRLAPDPLNGGGISGDVTVDWEICTDEAMRRRVRRGTALATESAAHSVHVDARGLQPGRDYWYRFRAAGKTSPRGHTRTMPARAAHVDRLRFAFASCQQYEHGYFTAYRHMAAEDLDLVVHLGDYIYEYAPDVYVAPGGNVRRHVGGETETLADYRNRHAQYKTDPDLQAAHAAFPWVVTWDDHEVENNYADERSENVPLDPAEIRRFLRRRANAYRAYWEHMPLRASSLPRGSDMRLYRRVAAGDLAAFNVLDTRQYRSDQPCGDAFPADCPERFDPGQTITGARQEAWLMDGLHRSNARWNVVAQQIFMAQIDLVPGRGTGYYVDGWDGYVASRDRLMSFIASRRPSNPVVLTGDWHANWLADLKADFNDPSSATLASEFVGTSISSTDVADPNAEYGREVLDENPHIRYFDNYRGYVRCDLNHERWRTDYRAVRFVNRPGAPIFTSASFEIEDGRAGAQRV